MRHIYFFLFSLFPYTILAKDPYPKNPNIDIINYKFEIHLNDTSDIIYGSADIALNIKDSEDRVRLDLISQGKDGMGMEVKKVTFNGSEVSYSHDNDVLLIETRAFEYSSRDIINVVYSGMPITGLIICLLYTSPSPRDIS